MLRNFSVVFIHNFVNKNTNYDRGTLFVPAACKLLTELHEMSIRAAQWINFKWNAKQGLASSHFALVCQHLLREGSTAFALVLENFSHPCTNGSFFLHQSVSVGIRSNRIPCDSGMLLEDIMEHWSWMMRNDAGLIISSPASEEKLLKQEDDNLSWCVKT